MTDNVVSFDPNFRIKKELGEYFFNMFQEVAEGSDIASISSYLETQDGTFVITVTNAEDVEEYMYDE